MVDLPLKQTRVGTLSFEGGCVKTCPLNLSGGVARGIVYLVEGCGVKGRTVHANRKASGRANRQMRDCGGDER
jgi:hypothetical protein